MKILLILFVLSYIVTWLSGIYLSKFAADKHRFKKVHFSLTIIS
jgi:hypothetical protein